MAIVALCRRQNGSDSAAKLISCSHTNCGHLCSLSGVQSYPLTLQRTSNKAKVKQCNVRWQANKGEAMGGVG